ncbi:unnamed protein product [Amoebophrya sp. A25]|nr:unnamed protein product [Amoebophrya sp. A25]|eukprot:GSA25T00014575001.1
MMLRLSLFASAFGISSAVAESWFSKFFGGGAVQTAKVSKCPGEVNRGGPQPETCTFDSTHRVCALLVEKPGGTCEKRQWGSGDFWQITGQTAFDWSQEICTNKQNPGEGWCICMWAFADLIHSVGCENVHLDCSATSVDYVLSKYTDGGRDLSGAHDCLKQKCSGGAMVAR